MNPAYYDSFAKRIQEVLQMTDGKDVVLEVKFDRFLEPYVSKFLEKYISRGQSVSKYVMGRNI